MLKLLLAFRTITVFYRFSIATFIVSFLITVKTINIIKIFRNSTYYISSIRYMNSISIPVILILVLKVKFFLVLLLVLVIEMKQEFFWVWFYY